MGKSILTEPRGKPNKETGQTKNATINDLFEACQISLSTRAITKQNDTALERDRRNQTTHHQRYFQGSSE